MILQALYDLAQLDGLSQDLDFQELPVSWWIIVNDEGQLINIEDRRETSDPEKGKKSRLIAPRLRVPVHAGRQSNIKPQFFVDNAQYVFGLTAPDKAAKVERVRRCFDAFREQVERCAESTVDEGARAVAGYLGQLAESQQPLAWNNEWEANDLFAFFLSSEPDRPIHLRPDIVRYWRRLREEVTAELSETRRCMVTGKAMGQPGLFPQVKKVPGGTPSGVSLVSFNARAFESYGWSGNENAPVSREAAESCATALQRLLDPEFPDPAQPGLSLPRRRYRLGSDTVVVYWSPQKAGQDVCNAFPNLLEADPALVGEMYRSVWTGKAPILADSSQFYAMTLTGTQGRIIVRDWLETSVNDVLQNLSQYFADVDIVRNTPPAKKRPHPPAMPLSSLARAMAVRGESDRLPKHLASEWLHAALTGGLFPRQALQRALERARAESSRNEWLDLDRRDTRAAIVKAYLNRSRRRDERAAQRYPEVSRMLDETIDNRGYVLGRLMAVLEKLQVEALGDINATLVDRYFKRASTTPLYIFKSLLNTRQSHERKLKRDKPGLAVTRMKQIDNLVDRIRGADNIPRSLSVEEQALFLLGYHHQRHALWTKKEDQEKLAAS